jgi:hypothetical protein
MCLFPVEVTGRNLPTWQLYAIRYWRLAAQKIKDCASPARAPTNIRSKTGMTVAFTGVPQSAADKSQT